MKRVSTAFLSFVFATAAFGQQYVQTNLVTNSTAAAPAPIIDRNINGAWCLSQSSGGAWWVNDSVTGLSTLYNEVGAIQKLVVTVPTANPSVSATGTPTGIVFNAVPTDFVLPDGKAAIFLFDTLDGTIQAGTVLFPTRPRKLLWTTAKLRSTQGWL